MEELFTPLNRSDRVISTCYKTIKAYYPGVPFSHLDKDSYVEKTYIGGRKNLNVTPKYRYSDYISIFNEVAETFGYHFFEFQERSVLDGYWVFKNEDDRLPIITITPGYHGNSCSYLIKMVGGNPFMKITECNANLKNSQDCFNVLYKKLHFAYKLSDFEDIKRNLALLNIRNKLKNK